MSFLDDLRELTYISPSGSTHRLEFDDLSRGIDPKAAVLEPPQQSRAEVQNLGFGGIRLPMTFYISGMDYHTKADALWAALTEPTDSRRPGTLQHPRWGDILVAVVSGPSQVERFVEEMGQAVFTVEFIRVDRQPKFPVSGTDMAGQLQADVDAQAARTEATYGANGAPVTPAQTVAVSAGTTNFLTATGDALRGVASASNDIAQEFEAGLATALASVDSLVADPLALAGAVTALVRAPAQAVTMIGDKIRGYQTILDGMVDQTVNSYAECELLLLGMGAVTSGACESTLVGDLETRTQALDAADLIDAMLDQLRAQVARAEATGWRADGDTIAALEDVLLSTAARLQSSSFDLKTERRRPLPSAMDPISATKMLYGTFTEALLDRLIKDCKLEDDELFVIPAGREMVWYV